MLLKGDSYTGVVSCEIWDILKNTCFEEHIWTIASVYWLLHHILIFTIHYSSFWKLKISFLEMFHESLTLARRRPIYRNQSIDLLCKSVDWFLYDIGLRRERVKKQFNWNLHCEINVKLIFHEILWRENFTVYPSLYENQWKYELFNGS